MRAPRFAFAALAALTLAACYPPATSHPVGTTAGAWKADPALVGLWKSPPDPSGARGVYVHFLPRMDGTTVAIMVQTGNEPDGDWYEVDLTTAKLGANRFMNARLVMGDGKEPDADGPAGTSPMLYRIDAKGTLTITAMDEAATKAAIKAGVLKGDPGQGTDGDAIITADAATLDKFMLSPAGLALFKKPMLVLRKME